MQTLVGVGRKGMESCKGRTLARGEEKEGERTSLQMYFADQNTRALAMGKQTQELLPEGLYGAVDLLGLGDRQASSQPKLSLGL